MRLSTFLLCIFSFAFGSGELQNAVNSAKTGDIIELGEGIYNGDIIIDKSITIDGKNAKAIIRGSGTGDVIKVIAPNVKLLNLGIQNTGDSHTDIHSGVKCLNSQGIQVIGSEFTNTLYGIDLEQCAGAKILGNKITSKPVELSLRGDAIRLWYSHESIVEDNYIYDAKDNVFWYSSRCEIRRNKGVGSRYSLHFMYANNNIAEDNIFEHNSVGMFFMYSHSAIIRNNKVFSSNGAFGAGAALKDASNFILEGNVFSHNARGLYLDQSPFQPNTENLFKNNKILYNNVGVQLHATQHKSEFTENDFFGNMDVAINDTPGSKIWLNEWRGNYFDDYEGFDRDGDGVGDVEYKNFAYFDTLWQYYPNLRFFYGSAAMSLLNFIAKLAPFSEPELLITDLRPRMRPHI